MHQLTTECLCKLRNLQEKCDANANQLFCVCFTVDPPSVPAHTTDCTVSLPINLQVTTTWRRCASELHTGMSYTWTWQRVDQSQRHSGYWPTVYHWQSDFRYWVYEFRLAAAENNDSWNWTRAVLSSGNRAKPGKFQYVQPVGNYMRKIERSKEKTRIFDDRTLILHRLTAVSLKRCKIRSKLLLITNKNMYTRFHSGPVLGMFEVFGRTGPQNLVGPQFWTLQK